MNLDLVQFDYDFERRYFHIGGQRMHYVDEGAGDPVIMVHGNPTWSFYYRNLIRTMRSTHRVIAPDHIGCGFSDKPDDADYEYTLKQHVDDLDALLERLGIRENVTLVVHDWGGMIGMAWAARHPERIKRIVAMNTAAFRLPKSKPLPWALNLCRNTPLGPLLVRGLNAFAFCASHVCCKRNPLVRELRHAYRMPYDNWANRIATIRFVQDIPLGPGDKAWETVMEVEKALPRFAQTPVLLLWGMKDFVFDRHFLADFLEHWPHATAHRFEDCGHYILEDVGQEALDLIQTFVKEN